MKIAIGTHGFSLSWCPSASSWDVATVMRPSPCQRRLIRLPLHRHLHHLRPSPCRMSIREARLTFCSQSLLTTTRAPDSISHRDHTQT